VQGCCCVPNSCFGSTCRTQRDRWGGGRGGRGVRGGCEETKGARRACVGRSLHSGTQRVACRRRVYLGVASSRSQRSHVCSLCCARGVRLRGRMGCLCSQRRACSNGGGGVYQTDLRTPISPRELHGCGGARGAAHAHARARTHAHAHVGARAHARARARARARAHLAVVGARRSAPVVGLLSPGSKFPR
jgi:hypothetical protein